MQENTTALQGIFDIEPPSIPTQILFEQNMLSNVLFSLLGLSVLALMLLFLWRHFLSDRGKARRSLCGLQVKLEQQQISHHSAVFQLSSILQNGLGLQQISIYTPLPEKMQVHSSRWLSFVEHLSVARYSARKSPATQISQLVVDAKHWLRLWP